MGNQPDLGDLGLAMLEDISNAAASSNTSRTLVQRVAEKMGRHMLLGPLELGWCEDARPLSATAVIAESSGVKELVRDLRGTEIGRIIQSGKSAFEKQSAGRQTLVIPLTHPDSAPGYARISFAANSPEDVLPEPVLKILASILTFAQRHCRLVERIAKLSSVAHEECQELRQELRKYTEGHSIVAQSDVMRRVLEGADLVAGHDTTVLLRGESGTGKELLARRIHGMSRRARQPFICVNCGALPETLIESELFGHEKGAFTGAVGRHRGRFERANNGTIFLDEIAELSASAQVKLLRVLQEGEFERLGGEEAVRVNVRVIAATNRPLEALVEQGSFRADLFYRINVFPIVIPPLRERTEDVPVLARTILAEISKRLRCRFPPLSAKGIARLVNHPWHGNVRELANTIERALIVSQGKELEFDDLAVRHADAEEPNGQAETFAEGARRSIRAALKASGGRIYGKQGAAALLGIPPSTLQGKMRRLGLRRAGF